MSPIMSAPMLRSPRVQLLLEQPEQPDYVAVIVQTDNRDMVRYDRARAQEGSKRWPAPSEGSILWLTFLAWSALKRDTDHADLAGATFDAFSGRCVQITSVDAEGNPVDPNTPTEPVDPTPAGLEPA